MVVEKSQAFGQLIVVGIVGMASLLTGCADGPLWKAGKYTPWARNQWAAEEQIADTLFARKRKMSEAVASVQGAPVEEQQRVAKTISEVVLRDSVLLLRLHGVNLLGKLNCPGALQTLRAASTDNSADIRIAAIKSWRSMPAETAIPQLQNIIGSDTNIDVRLAATRALGSFNGQQAISAASLALEDKDPALQLRAVESLQRITGESLGRDVSKWQQYVSQVKPQSSPTATESLTAQASQSLEALSPSATASKQDYVPSKVATKPDDSSSYFRTGASTTSQTLIR